MRCRWRMMSWGRVRRQRLLSLSAAFEKMDVDGSGSLSHEEYKRGITENREVMEELQQLGLDQETDLFDVLDVDGNGVYAVSCTPSTRTHRHSSSDVISAAPHP